MEKDAAGYPSLPLHYGLMNPGTSRTSPAAYPTSSPVLRGGGGGDAASLPDPPSMARSERDGVRCQQS